MVSRSKKNSAPITVDLTQELVAKIKSARKSLGAKNGSEVVRHAIEQFDFESCAPTREAHSQISVRVSAAQRAMLKRYARSKDSSVGELLRLALEGLTIKPARGARR